MSKLFLDYLKFIIFDNMVVIAYKIIRDFSVKYPKSQSSLDKWLIEVERADWNSFSDIKLTFSSTDYVGNDRYVFNIGGNNYRLIAAIHFNIRTLYIKFIGTHKEYDKIDPSNVKYKK